MHLILLKKIFLFRRHHHPDYNYADDDAALSGCAGCWFGLLVALAQVFLFGATALCLYWIVHYHTPKVGSISTVPADTISVRVLERCCFYDKQGLFKRPELRDDSMEREESCQSAVLLCCL